MAFGRDISLSHGASGIAESGASHEVLGAAVLAVVAIYRHLGDGLSVGC